MSSVAGWLTHEAISLALLDKAFTVMRSELNERFHYGEFGTQLHVLFESEDGATIASVVNERLFDNPGGATLHTLSNRMFVEVNVLVPRPAPSQAPNFDGLFERLGLNDVAATAVLGEQTTAFSQDCIPANKGMAVVDGLAIAACGDCGRFLRETDVGAAIKVAGERRGVSPAEVPSFAAWFLDILESDPPRNNWHEVLERTPTYLFTLVLDGRSDELELVGLRRNERLGGPQSPYQHLFYRSGEDGVHIARTASGVGALVGRDVSADIRLVADMAPARFRLSNLRL